MRVTIDDVRAVGDFQVLYNWNLSFIEFPSGVLGPNPAGLNIRCMSVDQPRLASQDIAVRIRGHEVFQPGIHTYGTINLVFQETEDNYISSFLKQWRDLCWEPQTGNQRPKNELEAIVRIARLNRQGEENWEYVLVGCFLEAYEPGGILSDAQSDTMRPAVTLRYDYFLDNAL